MTLTELNAKLDSFGGPEVLYISPAVYATVEKLYGKCLRLSPDGLDGFNLLIFKQTQLRLCSSKHELKLRRLEGKPVWWKLEGKMPLDPLEDYRKLAPAMEPPYRDRQMMEEMQRRIRVVESDLRRTTIELRLKDKQLMTQQIDEWRTMIEALGKMEAMLTEAIGHEKRLIGTEGMGWPGRLDQLVGELTRYRETLMRRIADKALERLAPSLDDNAQKEKIAQSIGTIF